VSLVPRPLLEDAFAHHVWATLRVIDTCLELTPEQLATAVPGTYGSILDTMRHLVAADSWYLFRLSGERRPPIEDEERLGLNELRSVMEAAGPAWAEVLAADPDPDALVRALDDDGTEVFTPTGIRLAQVLHHGTDHRSQICTALTTLGIEPPGIDVWDFAEAHGRQFRGAPPSA
jgi:uncharacterized damage-inducible protein DinB